MIRLSFVLLSLAPLLGGCSGDSAPSPAERRQQSPTEVLRELIAARQAGDYAAITALTHPDHADAVKRTLLAVDEFLAANRVLCDTIRDRVGIGLSQSVDQSNLARNLDIFSVYVELLDETLDEDVAHVSYLVDGRLPARRARLRRVGGRWYYDPGPGQYAELVDAFRTMAHGLRQVRAEIEAGRLGSETGGDQHDRVLEEVRVRLLPGVRKLPPPPAEADPLRGGGG